MHGTVPDTMKRNIDTRRTTTVLTLALVLALSTLAPLMRPPVAFAASGDANALATTPVLTASLEDVARTTCPDNLSQHPRLLARPDSQASNPSGSAAARDAFALVATTDEPRTSLVAALIPVAGSSALVYSSRASRTRGQPVRA